MFFALIECFNDRGAAGRLHRDHARPFRADPSDRFEFGKCLPHANQWPVPPPVGYENYVGNRPPELLGKRQFPSTFLPSIR